MSIRKRNRIGRFHLAPFLHKSPPNRYRGPTPGESGWIYVIQSGDACKVGITNNVRKRLKTLAIGNPMQCALILSRRLQSMEYAYIAEAEAHRMLSVVHVRGEWFASEPKQIAATVSLAAAATRVLHYRHWRMQRKVRLVEMVGRDGIPAAKPYV